MSNLRTELDALKKAVNRMRGGSFLNKAIAADDAMDAMLRMTEALVIKVESLENKGEAGHGE